jgi:forkhead transcription factor HCM1
MAATRRSPALQIYTDPDASVNFDSGAANVEEKLLSALQPRKDASLNRNIVLDPPSIDPIRPTPMKSSSPPASSPLGPHADTQFDIINFPAPSTGSFSTDSLPKGTLYPTALPAKSGNPPGSLLHTLTSTQPVDKENFYSDATFLDTVDYHSSAVHSQKPPLKRTLLEAAPLKERSTNAKRQKMDESAEPEMLPQPDDLPILEDDGAKPSYSYAQLIGMAILRAPNRRLTLAQIYKWISDTYSYYRNIEAGWQNSIRHNLSLNKAFIKQERPKDDPGKGNYWAIVPGSEKQFLKDKNAIRRGMNTEGQSFMQIMPGDMGGLPRPSTAPVMGAFPMAPFPIKRHEPKGVDASRFPDDTELSSDATIPASDPAIQEELDDHARMPPPSRLMASSPPAADIRSSPPAPIPSSSARDDTPPVVAHLPAHNIRSGGRKRKIAALNDSGYYSSIESSASRGKPIGPTSEADFERPSRSKRGRAEEEIARIRGSSYDSPSKSRPHIKHPSFTLISSSPLHSTRPQKKGGPLTPAVVFKRPIKPPPSVSPNTNLRNHRNRIKELIGSPTHGLSPAFGGTSWSPAFHISEDTITEDPYNETEYGNFDDAFDVWAQDTSALFLERGSPERRSAKRPRVERANTSAGVLGDITDSSKSNSMLRFPEDSFSLSPFKLDPPALRSPLRLSSPQKRDVGSPFPQVFDPEPQQEELFGIELGSDGSEEGLDILQGFQKIGAGGGLAPGRNPFGSLDPQKPSSRSRPGLDRRLTSIF